MTNPSASCADIADPTLVPWTSDAGAWGTGSANDSDTDLNAQPQTVRRLAGNGDFAHTQNGGELPRLQLQVNLTTCSCRFEMPAQIQMRLTDPDGTTSSAVLALGDLRTAWIPLHANWRQVYLNDIVGAQFPVHSLGWLIAGNAFETSYIPFGLGQLLFGGIPAPTKRRRGPRP